MKLIGLALLTVLFASGAFAQTKRPRITGVAHIALYVKDMDKARSYYREILGFSEPYDLKNADGTLSMTFFKVNERQYIELFPEKSPNTDRLNHISVETDDIEGMRRYLAEQGIAVPPKTNLARIRNKSFAIRASTSRTPMATPSNSSSTNPTVGPSARKGSICRKASLPECCTSAFWSAPSGRP